MFNSTFFTAIITALVAIYGYHKTQSELKKRDINEAHRKHKIDTYKQIMTFYSEILLNTTQNKSKLMPKNVESRIIQFTTDLINWGSADTILAFSKMKNLQEHNKNKILLYLDDLLFAIREDLDLSNKNLNKGDLVKLYLSNPEEMNKLTE